MFNANQFLSQELIYFWKGRVALYALLRAMGVDENSEVVVPGFTCVVVPNAVIYTGATPKYADIDSATFNVTLDSIKTVVTEKTKVIVIQSTFGLSPDLEGIVEFANARGILLIDDCTHGLGGSYKGVPNGCTTDASFFSTQWSKPVSTGLGGLALVQNEQLLKKLIAEIRDYERASNSDDLILAVQRFVRPLADIPQLHYALVSVYRWLTQKAGLSVGSSSGGEVSGTEMPTDFCRLAGARQEKAIRNNINHLSKDLEIRQESALFYDSYFDGMKDVVVPSRPSYATHGMLRYSILVNENKSILSQAARENIPVGDWFNSPLYPISGDMSLWHYSDGTCPVAEDVCKRIVNLPTTKRLSEKQLDKLFEGNL